MEDYRSKEFINSSSSGTDTDSSDVDTDSDADITYVPSPAKKNEIMDKYIQTLQDISETTNNYNSFITLIDLARQLNDLEKIRESYELFAAAFPLAPHLWLRLIKVELSLAEFVNEIDVQKLFKRALADYFSCLVATEYAKFAIKSTTDLGNEIWDEILSVYALDCVHGGALFDMWHAYMQEKDLDPQEKQRIIVEMYERQLSIPLQNMENSYATFQGYCAKQNVTVDWNKIDEIYNKAKDQLYKMLPHEKALLKLDVKEHEKRFTIYTNYINDCKSYLDEKFTRILYERFVANCCLNESCWLLYIKYVQSLNTDYVNDEDTEIKNWTAIFHQCDLDIVNRGIRNCIYSSLIHVEKIRIGERMELSKDEVRGIFESALAVNFITPEPIVALWLEYLTYLRRNTDFAIEKEKLLLQSTFQLAWDSLGKQFGELADCNCEILQMWGKLCYGPLNDLGEGKELWTTVMNSGDNSTKSGLWLEFANLELKRCVDGARKIYRKAIAIKYTDDIYVIASTWICFERCNGTLDQLKSCQEICQQHINAYLKWCADFDIKIKTNPDDQYKLYKKQSKKIVNDTKSVKNVIDKPKNSKIAEKRKLNNNNNNNEPIKKHKIDYTEIQHIPPTIDTSKDDVTIFLSNLDFGINEKDIRDSFPELNITKVNLIKNATGRCRGYGYVELETIHDVQTAFQYDRRMINGRPTFISSVIREKQQRGKFKYSDELEPRKLFVKGLPLDIKETELEEKFKCFGTLKDVRVVYKKNGQPKGIAFVEYENEKSAQDAILKMDDTELNGSKISVAISAPPQRNKEPTIVKSLINVNEIGLGEGRRSAKLNNKGDLKPRLTFIPRSVQKNVQSTSSNEKIENTDASATPPSLPSSLIKSNDDFRKFLNK